MNYLYIIDKNVTGVTWRKPGKKKGNAVGSRIPYWYNLEQ